MLNPTYRYIALDFETTGLDIHTDEPIQIGIAEITSEGHFIWGYQSLLRPQKSLKHLKSIVGFITGLSLEQLNTAPTPEDILSEIEHFFGSNTIIVGHNVGFDLAFLQKFFPSLTRAGSIDTFRLSQELIHYTPSYAQEVLIQQLQQKAEFSQILVDLKFESALTFHDAFFDAKLSLALFVYLIRRCEKLFTQYPILHQLAWKSDGVLVEVFAFERSESISISHFQSLSLPPLKKITPVHTQLLSGDYSLNLEDFEDKKSFHVANLSFKSLLSSLATHKKLILSFSTKPKLDIAKNLLNELGIKNIGFAKEEQTLNPQAMQKFIQRNHFSASEFWFLLKYFSHHEQGLGVLDLNTKENYEIYTALKDQREVVDYPIVLTTHGWLFSLLEQGEKYEEYQICFFDASWRYKSFNFYLSRPYDPNYTLNYLDMLAYKYSLALEYQHIGAEEYGLLEEFRNFFIMFVGILGQETKKFFTNTDMTTMTLNPIVSDIAFYQTNKLLVRFDEFWARLEKMLENAEFMILRKQIQHMQKIFSGICMVEKKMYERSAFSFIYAEEVKFTSRVEFTQLFSQHKTLFFSNIANEFPPLLPEIQPPLIQQEQLAKKIKNLSKVPSVLKELEIWMSTSLPNAIVFILSVKKEESKQLFEDLIANGFDQECAILVENITWGSGKNLFNAKSAGRKVIIWGYNFLLQLCAQKLAISQLIVYNSKGQQQDLIFNDILRYGSKNLMES